MVLLLYYYYLKSIFACYVTITGSYKILYKNLYKFCMLFHLNYSDSTLNSFYGELMLKYIVSKTSTC